MFKPLIPVIKDAYSHTFGEAIHLATVHAKYGSNHLEHALATAGAENNGKNQKNASPGENFQLHIKSPECLYDLCLFRIENSYSNIRIFKLSAIFLAKIVPPPR